MGSTLGEIQQLIARREVVVSVHAYDEMTADGLTTNEVVDGAASAIVVEDYPHAKRGPSVLVLQHDIDGKPFHVVWGIAKDATGPAVVITAYRPDPTKWFADFTRRK